MSHPELVNPGPLLVSFAADDETWGGWGLFSPGELFTQILYKNASKRPTQPPWTFADLRLYCRGHVVCPYAVFIGVCGRIIPRFFPKASPCLSPSPDPCPADRWGRCVCGACACGVRGCWRLPTPRLSPSKPTPRRARPNARPLRKTRRGAARRARRANSGASKARGLAAGRGKAGTPRRTSAWGSPPALLA